MTQVRRPAGKDTKTSSLTPSAILISHMILAWHVSSHLRTSQHAGFAHKLPGSTRTYCTRRKLCTQTHTLFLRHISGSLTFAWWFRLLIARVMPAPPPCRIIAALPGTMLSKEIETMTWVVLHHNYSFMSTVQNQMVHFRSTAAKLHTGNFSSSLVWTGLPFLTPLFSGPQHS